MAKQQAPKGVRKLLRKALQSAFREVPEDVQEFFRESGRSGGKKGGAIGGKTAAANMTPEQRKARAKKAAAARWEKVATKSALTRTHDSAYAKRVNTEKLSVPLGRRALVARVNRKLRHDGAMGRTLKTARSEAAERELGRYFIVDVHSNHIHDHHVDLERLARELGLLQPWEQLESTPDPPSKKG